VATTFSKHARLKAGMKRTLFILLLSLFLAGRTLQASPIKISFLDNEEAVKKNSRIAFVQRL
jgi:hypothetical protein